MSELLSLLATGGHTGWRTNDSFIATNFPLHLGSEVPRSIGTALGKLTVQHRFPKHGEIAIESDGKSVTRSVFGHGSPADL